MRMMLSYIPMQHCRKFQTTPGQSKYLGLWERWCNMAFNRLKCEYNILAQKIKTSQLTLTNGTKYLSVKMKSTLTWHFREPFCQTQNTSLANHINLQHMQACQLPRIWNDSHTAANIIKPLTQGLRDCPTQHKAVFYFLFVSNTH